MRGSARIVGSYVLRLFDGFAQKCLRSVIASAHFVPAGTEIRCSSRSANEVARWDCGRNYPVHVARGIIARHGAVAIRAGANAELIVRRTGRDIYTLDLESVNVNGQRYAINVSGLESFRRAQCCASTCRLR